MELMSIISHHQELSDPRICLVSAPRLDVVGHAGIPP